jgi:hypothetical protein
MKITRFQDDVDRGRRILDVGSWNFKRSSILSYGGDEVDGLKIATRGGNQGTIFFREMSHQS